jgi:hypothetical protein
MRKPYGPEHPHTLSVLMARPGLDPAAAGTDEAGTLSRRAFRDRPLHTATALRAG